MQDKMIKNSVALLFSKWPTKEIKRTIYHCNKNLRIDFTKTVQCTSQGSIDQ